MREYIQKYVNSCDICQHSKTPTTQAGGLLQPLEIPERKWESVSMDFIVGLTSTKQGHDANYVCVDKLSKMTHLMATTTTVTAEETTKLFRDYVHKLHGIPLKLISNRDARFTGRFWQELHYLLGIQLAMSTSFHFHTNGQT